MPFERSHPLLSRRFTPALVTAGTKEFYTVSEQGEFFVRVPGRLKRRAEASYRYHQRIDPTAPGPVAGQPPRPGSTPLHGGVESTTKTIPLTLRIFTPDGAEFTGSDITLADLNRYRRTRAGDSGRRALVPAVRRPNVCVRPGLGLRCGGLPNVRVWVLASVPEQPSHRRQRTEERGLNQPRRLRQDQLLSKRAHDHRQL